MLVSAITVEDVAEYLRLEVATDPILSSILITAKKFVESYTGIHDENLTDSFVGNGEGFIFKLSKSPIVADSVTVLLNEVELENNTDYTVDYIKGTITLLTVPEQDAAIEIGYEFGLDAFEEFYIVVMVLCQDMYDNRTYYVDNQNLNKVVQTILDMHCRNLLPSSGV
jgi:hypothetical protein